MQKMKIAPKIIMGRIHEMNQELYNLQSEMIYYEFSQKKNSKTPISDLWEKTDFPIDDILDWEQYEKDLADAYMEKR